MVVQICIDSKVFYFIVEMSSVYGDKPSQFSQCIIRNTKQGYKIRSAMFFLIKSDHNMDLFLNNKKYKILS